MHNKYWKDLSHDLSEGLEHFIINKMVMGCYSFNSLHQGKLKQNLKE